MRSYLEIFSPLLKLVSILVIGIPLTSCYKEVPVDLPPHKPVLVANSFFRAGHPIKVNVSTSKFIYDSLSVFEDTAAVIIRKGNSSEKLTYLGNGNYITHTMMAEEKGKYSLEVSNPQYHTIYAEDSVPEQIPFQLVRFVPGARIDEEGYTYSLFEITFSDKPEEKNFYEINMIVKGVIDNTTYYDVTRLSSDDPYVLNEGDQEYYPMNILLSDEMFNGKKVFLTFYGGYQAEYDREYFLHFRCISADYYHYKKKLIRHFENQYPDIWYGTGNPVMLFSNIQDGFGIFAGYTQQDTTIIISP